MKVFLAFLYFFGSILLPVGLLLLLALVAPPRFLVEEEALKAMQGPPGSWRGILPQAQAKASFSYAGALAGISGKQGGGTIRVLLFALSQERVSGRHAPHEYPENCVAYTSTHDSPTLMGWFESAGPSHRQSLFKYLGREVGTREVPTECVKLLMSSRARVCIFPLHDLLGLGDEARINRPGTVEGNWEWRVLPQQLSPELVKTLRRLTVDFGRA